MAKRNQYNRPNMDYSQLSSVAFDGKVTLGSVMTVPQSASLQRRVVSGSTISTAISHGSIVNVTQHAPAGLLSFSDVSVSPSESFSIVLANNFITMNSTVYAWDMSAQESIVNLSASTGGEVKLNFNACHTTFTNGPLVIRYFIVGTLS